MFAFGLTTLSQALLIPQQTSPGGPHRAISLLVLATTIFRAELAILLSATGLTLLLSNRIPPRQLITVVIGTLCAALVVSVPLDSYFWQKPVWPELWGFYFNAVLGSSSAWGVSPWHYYFTSAIPRTRHHASTLLVPSLSYIALYSLQPHKETRFIFYVVPPLTAAAALGADYVTSRRSKSKTYKVATLILISSVLATATASTAMLLVSSLNYPGGDALSHLQDLIARTTTTTTTTTTPDGTPPRRQSSPPTPTS
ncbi:Alg9-like mannosyltransferase [Ophiocordyceps camponoti-floridani]|uniref:Mannosyltransferase n=1 Tax=Ophiocordyceps camponoti-floridani TaxID=2030778 RepID=A0A8H4VCV4_9HYPO|nr:Alg9-like mannosyltransferase [Ophiocordyceps camponoti-floridani]